MHEHTRRDTEICYALRMIELSGKRVTVMGLGRFGGGAGVSRWLCQQGARVVITDMKTEEQLGDAVGDVADLVADGSATLRLGRHDRSDCTATDLVIANPAVPMPWSNEFLLAAAEAGVAINTEVGLLIERLPSRERVIGITGTVGKSTTTAMAVHAIRALGLLAVVGGNLGGSLLGELAAITPETRVVLELSSAMLYWIERVQKWSPHVAVVTNFSENHGDWHGHIEHYRRSKQALLANQGPRAGSRRGDGVAAVRRFPRGAGAAQSRERSDGDRGGIRAGAGREGRRHRAGHGDVSGAVAPARPRTRARRT
jgi:UDP-N-acetylmuramoylalanine--D-glutamate ligase